MDVDYSEFYVHSYKHGPTITHSIKYRPAIDVFQNFLGGTLKERSSPGHILLPGPQDDLTQRFQVAFGIDEYMPRREIIVSHDNGQVYALDMEKPPSTTLRRLLHMPWFNVWYDKLGPALEEVNLYVEFLAWKIELIDQARSGGRSVSADLESKLRQERARMLGQDGVEATIRSV